MQGYEIKFNVYADSPEEAELASKSIKNFINGLASKGIPVTGRRITEAMERWKDNLFVANYFKK